MTVRRDAKEVAEILHRAYDENCTLAVAAERLADLRDRLYFLASVVAEVDMDEIPGSEKVIEDVVGSPEHKRALEKEAFVSGIADALDDILKRNYPEA